MTLVIQCRYCPRNFPVEFGPAAKLVAPERDALKLSCPHCKCKLVLDLALRRKGKSAQYRAAEKARHAEAEAAGRAEFEGSAAYGSGQTWEEIGRLGRSEYIARAARKLQQNPK